ncbi:hypothetical protein [Blastomonas sp.]|uniref:hypothetical protein n=1 Tax=Blastomonas sp. TaxID=1909299 RepID=UPI002635A5BF|nr:hypothetical protein [Blastomonas sp.]MDM7957355.1 hypothetical protein [Blastomonas sp.]
MIELIPYMLMLVWPAPDQPGGFEIERVASLFASEADCDQAAAQLVADASGRAMAHRCLPVPNTTEYDRLFAQIDAKRSAPSPERGE